MHKISNLIIFTLFFLPVFLTAQKKQKDFSSISINSGLLIYHTKLFQDYSIPSTIEYQYTKRKNSFGIGIQLEFSGKDIFIDSNIYVLLPKCVFPSRAGSAPLVCPYSYTYEYRNFTFLTSYQYNIVENTKMSFGIKSSTLFYFNFYTHYTDKHPKINPESGVLLDPGPFETDVTFKKFKFQNIDLAIAPVFQYHITSHLSPFVSIQFQYGINSFIPITSRDIKLFALAGLRIKI